MISCLREWERERLSMFKGGGVYQFSVRYCFITVLEALSREFREGLPIDEIALR